MFGNTHVYTNTCMYERKIDKKEVISLKKLGMSIWGGLEVGKRREKCCH